MDSRIGGRGREGDLRSIRGQNLDFGSVVKGAVAHLDRLATSETFDHRRFCEYVAEADADHLANRDSGNGEEGRRKFRQSQGTSPAWVERDDRMLNSEPPDELGLVVGIVRSDNTYLMIAVLKSCQLRSGQSETMMIGLFGFDSEMG